MFLLESTLFWTTIFAAAVGLSLWRPLIGFCVVYPFLFFCGLRVDFLPFLHTPFGWLAIIVTGLALLCPKRTGMGWTTPILIPWLLLVGVLLYSVVIGHGDPAAIIFRVRTYVMGMWPFVLASLVIKTPRHARVVLTAALGTAAVAGFALLATMLLLGRGVIMGEYGENQMRNLGGDAGGFMSLLNYPVLVALAVSAPPLLAFALEARLNPRLRFLAGMGWCVLAACILISSYGSPVAALLLGSGVVLALRFRQLAGSGLGIVFIGLALVGGYLAATRLPAVERTISRIRNPQEDSSGAYRLMGITEETKAFLEAPFRGHGVKAEVAITPAGHLMTGHNSITRDAASFGLLFLVPFFALLTILGWLYQQLLGRLPLPADTAAINGMFASFFASIGAGFLTCTFGDAMHDTYFWTFTGVLLFWNHWIKTQPAHPAPALPKAGPYRRRGSRRPGRRSARIP